MNRLFAVNRMECSYGAVSVFFSHLTSATYSSKNAFEWLQNHRGSTQKTSSLYQLGHKKSQSKILSRAQNLAMFSLTYDSPWQFENKDREGYCCNWYKLIYFLRRGFEKKIILLVHFLSNKYTDILWQFICFTSYLEWGIEIGSYSFLQALAVVSCTS